ncbi:hypothetical protein A33M_3033 [Rhodovulum sp. PH10]|uniref:sulfite exporter TauE/SafE family protein n=1 Tax=Rhodovulum sp. PH10 TaxID=1187851 RepID=UPI00027C2D82|nr:sulfite exporter TauE/SafE family protein [Rhodovulum sp. PH10]EJW11555.1 hypothetical protein A33M_3033 [Rhodovulum sp. PH10]
MGEVPVGELLALAGVIAVGGVFTGLLAGLFGIGGGAVLVPVLFEVFGFLGVPESVHMQLCVGTSLAVIAPTAFRSYRTHKAKGAALEHVVRGWTVPVVLGVVAGAVLAVWAPAPLFKIVFAAISLGTAVRMLAGGERWRLGATLPGPWLMRIYGWTIGLLSSLMGVGGGALSTIVLTLYGQPIHTAVATSAGLGVPIALTGTVGYVIAGLFHQSELPPLSIGFVSLVGFALMAPISAFTARIGAQIAHRLRRRTLELAFGLFLIMTSSRFVVSMIW